MLDDPAPEWHATVSVNMYGPLIHTWHPDPTAAWAWAATELGLPDTHFGFREEAIVDGHLWPDRPYHVHVRPYVYDETIPS